MYQMKSVNGWKIRPAHSRLAQKAIGTFNTCSNGGVKRDTQTVNSFAEWEGFPFFLVFLTVETNGRGRWELFVDMAFDKVFTS